MSVATRVERPAARPTGAAYPPAQVPFADYHMSMGIKIEWLEAYLAKVTEHIRYVQDAGKVIGVPVDQLSMHDASKFYRAEFGAYARQFHGDSADRSGFAAAWLHHIHHNPHHWQHWIFADGYSPKQTIVEAGVLPMPDHYALEMVADWMGASMAYTGSWDMGEWLHRSMPTIRLHSLTAAYVREVLTTLGYGDVVAAVRFAGEVAP